MTSLKITHAGTLDRSRVADQIFEDLRGQIVRGTLPQGTKLPTERELTIRYGVSGPTVREAIRGLTATGLIDVRHGSGAYVTANTTSLVAVSLSTVIQLENLGITDVMSVLGALLVDAAGLAAGNSTDADKALLKEASAQLDAVETVESAAAAVRTFNGAIALAAHSPLLAILYGFLGDLLMELSIDLTADSMDAWRQVFDELLPHRYSLIKAIASGDASKAMRVARKFHDKAVAAVTSLPRANEVRLRDPRFGSLLRQMNSRISTR